jgi:hypothetical protein
LEPFPHFFSFLIIFFNILLLIKIDIYFLLNTSLIFFLYFFSQYHEPFLFSYSHQPQTLLQSHKPLINLGEPSSIHNSHTNSF